MSHNTDSTTGGAGRKEIHHTAKRLASAFISQYYSALILDPLSLTRFYRPISRIVHGTSTDGNVITDDENDNDGNGNDKGESSRVVDGSEDSVRRLIRQIDQPQISLTSTECMNSLQGSVLIVVHGSIKINKTSNSRDFSHTFLLAHEREDNIEDEQVPPRYFILNEVFKYLSSGEGKDTERSVQPIQGTLVLSHDTLPMLPGILGIEGIEVPFALEHSEQQETRDNDDNDQRE